MSTWLDRVRHDLVKRLVWPARDRLDIGGAPAPGELAITLNDETGNPIGAAELWQSMRIDAPSPTPPEALDAFGAAVARAVAAATRGDPVGVAALDEAFDQLAQIVKRSASP